MKCTKCEKYCYAKSDGKIGPNKAVSNCCGAEIYYLQHHNVDYSKDKFQSCSHHNFTGTTTGMNGNPVDDVSGLPRTDPSQNLPKADAYSLLAEVRAIYDELLEDAMYLYQYYPNNFRKTAEEYFKKEIEMQKKISEHFS